MSEALKATAALAKKVAALKALKDRIKELEAEEKALDLEVRAAFGDNFGTLIYKDLVIATFIERNGTRVDMKALEAKHPAIVAKFKRDTSTTVLSLK